MDFDPRDYCDERDPRDRDWDNRDHDDDAAPTIGRGSSSNRVDEHHDECRDREDDGDRFDHRDRTDDRWPDPDRDPRERNHDSRDVFTRGLELPRGRDREIVCDSRDREYTLRGSESRTLARVGAFRVVPARDLRDHADRPADPRNGDLRHLRNQGLIETVRIPGYREQAVVLTDRGRDLLDANRSHERDRGQVFYAGVKRERELEHDAQIHAAYEREAARLEARGAEIERVQLDYELKREYQRFLQERNRDRHDSDGRPTRTREEVQDWAYAHDLPIVDERVQFPDFRIEYEWPDGRRDAEDIEVTTPHYRGAHAAAKARSGFTRFRAASSRVGGRMVRGGGRGRSPDPHLAEEFLE